MNRFYIGCTYLEPYRVELNQRADVYFGMFAMKFFPKQFSSVFVAVLWVLSATFSYATQVTAGSTVVLSVTADGTAPFSYQWSKDGANLAGSTGPVLTLTNIQNANAGSYAVLVANAAGSVSSDIASITVTPATALPTIVTQPLSKRVASGSSVTFTVTASGTPAPTYQWKKNGVNISGATKSSYTIAAATAANAATYTVVLTNSAGSVTSNGAVLTIGAVLSGVTDFNGDNQADLLWQNTVTGERFIWFMNGSGHTGGTSLGFVDVSWSMVATNDFNGDGQTDILWQNKVTGERYLWLMSRAGHVSDISLGVVSTDWSIASTNDFNGDGTADILWQNKVTGERYIWFMSGAGHVGDASLGIVPTDWSIADTADFNGDGSPDILWQNTVTGERYIWFMSGTSHTGGASLGIVDTSWSIVLSSDFNKDGFSDILWQNTVSGQRYLWLMNGVAHQSDVDLGFVDPVWQLVK